MMPKTMTMKAPVGPPICTLLPPNTEMSRPAIMAVMIPFSGVTPDAIPKAMASGSATIPTMIPAMRSAMKVLLLYPFRQENNFGWNSNNFIVKKMSIYANTFIYTDTGLRCK